MLAVSDDFVPGVLAGVAITLVGGTFFFILERRWNKKRPVYFTSTTTLVADLQSRVEHLQIEYAGKPVQTLLRTYVGFWNAGRRTIGGGDLPYLAPTSIAVEGGDILDAKLVASTAPETDIQAVLEDDNRVAVEFAFLDHRQGGVVQVMHTGGTVKMTGSVVGTHAWKRRSAEVSDLLATPLLGLLILVTALPPVLVVVLTDALGLASWLIVVAGILAFALGVVLVAPLARWMPQDKPREIAPYAKSKG